MSGTSLDGLDIAFCTFYLKDNQSWIYKIIAAECIDYTAEWKSKLQDAVKLNGQDLLLLHREYGFYLGGQVMDFIEIHAVAPDLVSSHGHTIFHDPKNKLTFQLGDGAALHAATNIPVVCDFRSVDVSLGGQGAPLVPVGDELLFSEYDFCLNLGGIANISYKKENKRLAYDICGCNLLLNTFARENGKEYDENGNLARSGKVSQDLLNALNNWNYYSESLPKSLDKETMLQELLPLTRSFQLPIEDTLATLVEHIAIQVGKSIGDAKGKMLITGGGAFNKFLVERIQKHSEVSCIIPDEETVNFKEALIFAFLGVLRSRNEVNCLASVTGASRDNIGGAVYGPLNFNIGERPKSLKRQVIFVISFLLFFVFVFIIFYISWKLTGKREYYPVHQQINFQDSE
jgi:anhydro-N-acetylmuramic acid kinase